MEDDEADNEVKEEEEEEEEDASAFSDNMRHVLTCLGMKGEVQEADKGRKHETLPTFH